MSQATATRSRSKPASVPCTGCTACCKQDLIRLDPERDDMDAFAWHYEGGRPTLDRKQNGECVYLAPAGCGIHDRAPTVCRAFDCRVLEMTVPPRVQAIRIMQNPTMGAVYEAGRARRASLKR
jgi:hypothetical protein